MKRLQRAARFASACVAAISFAGCRQQIWIEPNDRAAAISSGLNIGDIERHPYDPIGPSRVDPNVKPSTVLDPSRPARLMTLKECIAIALEQGNVGLQSGVLNAGNLQDTPYSFTGNTLSGTDSIKCLVLDPAITGANIEKSLSKFDARWITSMSWSNQDQAVLNLQQSFSNGDSASFSSTLAKPLPTGGLAGISLSMNYLKLSNPPTNQSFVSLTTSYTPQVQFIFEQPLLKGFGVEINELTNAHPGSVTISGLTPSGGTNVEGILITRIRFDQTKADFDRLVNQMLLNVEYAYWNLYAAYYNLYAQEDTLKQSFELYIVLKKRFEVGSLKKQDFTQTEAQYWLFRSQALAARNQVQQAERTLRGLLGMDSNDGQRLVPVDDPVLAPYSPDYYEQAGEALAYKPELLLGRMDLKYRQLDMLVAKDSRRPDLRFFSTYNINGLGQALDGSTNAQSTVSGTSTTVPNNAFTSLGSNQFNSWQLGLRLDMPLGFRDANATVHQARLNIARSLYQLQDAERKTLEVLTAEYRDVAYQQEAIRINRKRRIVLQETLDLQRRVIEVGNWDVNALSNVLQTQRDTAAAIAQEFQSVAQYNQALAGLEYAKGTSQRYNNVSVSEGPLPEMAAKKAADHFSARQAALLLRERETPVDLPKLPALAQPWDSPVENDKFKLPPLPAGMTPEKAPLPVPAPAPAPVTPKFNLPEPPPDVKPMAPQGPITRNAVEPGTSNVPSMPAQPVPVQTSDMVLPALPEEAQFKPVGTVQIPPSNVRPDGVPVNR